MVVFTLPGCRSANGVQVDVMERELRQQENYIYELEDYLAEYSDKLRKCRCAHQCTDDDHSTVRNKSSSTSVPTLAEDDLSDDDLNFDDEREGTANSGMPEKPESEVVSESDMPESTTEAEPAQAEPNTIEETPVEDLQVPDFEIEEPSAFKQDVSPLIAATTTAEVVSAGNRPLDIPDPANFQPEAYRSSEAAVLQNAILENDTQNIDTSYETEGYNDQTDDSLEDEALDFRSNDIDRIVIQHLFRGTSNDEVANDDRDGKEEAQEELSFEQALFANTRSVNSLPASLLAVVEIRDQLNEPVEANGPVSLMVMAISDDKTARRIQRWDYSEEEVNASWQSSEYGDGLHLELPLDEHSSPNGQLELWARLVSTEGQKYLTKLPFEPQELVAFGDTPVPTTDFNETRISAHGGRESSQLERNSDLSDSYTRRPAAPTSQWRSSLQSETRRSYLASNTTKGTNNSVRWSAQPVGGRLGQTSSAVAATDVPKLHPSNAKPNNGTTPANDSPAWRTVPHAQ